VLVATRTMQQHQRRFGRVGASDEVMGVVWLGHGEVRQRRNYFNRKGSFVSHQISPRNASIAEEKASNIRGAITASSVVSMIFSSRRQGRSRNASLVARSLMRLIGSRALTTPPLRH